MAGRKRALRRWVIKAGSNLVCTGGRALVGAWMRQVAELRDKHGIEVIWVTSGAIAVAEAAGAAGSAGAGTPKAGKGAQGKAPARRGRLLPEKQALSAIGQPIVMQQYNQALDDAGLKGAQILLTYGDLADRDRRQNFHRTVVKLLDWGVTPILNENDAVATDEIKFGDNDSLSAKVARDVGAERLVLLTDVQGLCDADPRSDPAAQLIPRVWRVTPTLLRKTQGPGTARGTGGMYSKLSAAHEASRRGIETWLVRGDRESVLLEVAKDKPVGTVVAAQPRA